MRNLVLVVALCTGAPSAAIAGEVSLDAALQRSELVVTIQLDTPHATKVSVPVPPPKSVPEKECGTYEAHVVTGKVVEVLHPPKMRFTVVQPDGRTATAGPGPAEKTLDAPAPPAIPRP